MSEHAASEFGQLKVGDEVVVDRHHHGQEVHVVGHATKTRLTLDDGTVWSRDFGRPVPRQSGFSVPRLIPVTPAIRKEIRRAGLMLFIVNQRSDALQKLTTEQLTTAATALGWEAAP